VEAVAALEIHLKIRQLGDAVNRPGECLLVALKGVNAQFVVHEQAEPETEAADFDGLLLDVHAEEAVLDEVFLRLLSPVPLAFNDYGIAVAVGDGLENAEQADEFMEQTDRESAGADGGIETAKTPGALAISPLWPSEQVSASAGLGGQK
jgi:hypothetical protein